MVHQIEFTLRPRRRGFHLITDEVLQHLQALPKVGLLNLCVAAIGRHLQIGSAEVKEHDESCPYIWGF